MQLRGMSTSIHLALKESTRERSVPWWSDKDAEVVQRQYLVDSLTKAIFESAQTTASRINISQAHIAASLDLLQRSRNRRPSSSESDGLADALEVPQIEEVDRTLADK